MKKRNEINGNSGIKTVEYILASVVSLLTIAVILSSRVFHVNYLVISSMTFVFIVVRAFDIIRRKGTSFEDYLTLGMILIFGVIYTALKGEINAVIMVIASMTFLYSVGLVSPRRTMLQSRSLFGFIMGYAVFTIAIVVLFAGAYYANNETFIYIEGGPSPMTFEDSLYFSAVTYSSVAYGEILPLGINRLLTSIQSLIAMIVNVAFIGWIFGMKNFDDG